MQANQKKVKSLIILAIFIAIVLVGISVFLIVKINIAKNTISNQQKQIEELQKQIDYNNFHNPKANISSIAITSEVEL